MRRQAILRGLFSTVAATALIFVSMGVFAESAKNSNGKTEVIRIEEGYVTSAQLAIAPGTTVIWHNSTARPVAVNFGTGDQVKLACISPSGFTLKGDVFSAPNLGPGGTASLCFVNPGTYRYSVNPKGATGGETDAAQGTIVVRPMPPKT